MTQPIIPGEVITGIIVEDEVSSSAAIAKYLEGCTDYERERFLQIAHHLVYIGFESGVTRSGTGFTRATEVINQLLERETGKAYMRGLLDMMSIVEQGIREA